MGGPILLHTLHARELLQTGWSLASGSEFEENRALAGVNSAWLAINSVASVGAAFRSLGQWSLDGPTRRFDAENWWFRLEFDALPASPNERVILGLDGLATMAQVWLNGVELLTSSNMFIAHTCDVGQILQTSRNTLLLRFGSLDAELAVRRTRPRWRAPMVEHQQLRWFRTTVLGRTPGWSPPAAVVGPWKDVWLERRRKFELHTVALIAQVRGADGVLDCRLVARALGQSIEFIELCVTRSESQARLRLQLREGQFFGALVVPNVTLWWPHTHGDPALYEVTANVRLVGEFYPTVVSLGRVGFRTLHWDTANGNFALTVNGVPVFCRGACWTPLDAVTLRGSAPEYMEAVGQVTAAGMNMLRIPGTLVYEEDAFFDACDAQGVLLWQDFMFANMDFPADDPAFVESVTTEVRQQLSRIHARACLAVLCGNSEVAQQAAMWGAPADLWSNSLFDELLPRLCAELAPTTQYWPSSANGGAFPHQGNVGTTSYYGVGAYLRGFDDVRRADLKFATECLAFANIPPDATIERMPGGMALRVHHADWKARSPRDLGAGWDFDDVRDHYLAVFFGTDPLKLRYSDHRRYLTLSRMATGEAMAVAFSEWRRPGSSCHGAMVLYLRDLWAGAGWGILDDSGLPKACYYALKRVLQPVTVLLSDEGGNGLMAHLINETAKEQQLELEICAWRNGDVLVARGSQVFNLHTRASQSQACTDLLGRFLDLTHAYRFGAPVCDAVVATLRTPDGYQVAQTFYFPQGMSALSERDVGLHAEAVQLDANTLKVNVSTRRLAIGVHFEAMGFTADNEFFHLAPHGQVTVILRSSRPRIFSGVVSAVNSIADAPMEQVAC
ncbi:MAG: glycoside hydrolase family 2 protein [Burkholderiales bacterium]|nr:glycoside hydrolase family 2 protein [Burkholderiales bacterium]